MNKKKETQPDIQHAIGRPFATWGCGYIALQAALAAHRSRRLARVIAPSYAPSAIPGSLIEAVPEARAPAWWKHIPYRVRVRFALNSFIADNSFDLAARKHIAAGGVLHGWTGQCLYSFRRAKELGCKLVLERPNTHPIDMSRLVSGEHRKFDFTGRAEGPFQVSKYIKELKIADRIIVCSEFARQSHLSHGVPDNKLRVINYGVDTETFCPSEKHDEVFRVVYCGMVCLRKGPQYLLQAWKELNLKGAELWIIGLVLDDAVKMIKQFEGLPGLRITGHVNSQAELAELYRQGSVFIFPSVEDGFGMVVTEAMSCGVPVVISENTGARDVVREGENGFVIPIYDVEAIKDRILRFKENPSLSTDMGHQARATALDNTWLHYSEKLLAVYDELSPS